MFRCLVILALSLVAAVAVAADKRLWKCEKSGGGFRYVSAPAEESAPGRACEDVSPTKPAASPAAPSAKPQAKPARAAANKRVSPARQKRRDDKRGEILLYELRSEWRTLEAVDARLKNPKAGDNDKTAAALRGRRDQTILNITALEQELARLDIYVDYSRD